MSFQPGATAGVWPVAIGTIIAYQEFTSNVAISGTSGAQTTVVTAPAFTTDGFTSYWVMLFSVEIAPGASDFVVCTLWDGATNLGQMGVVNGATGWPMLMCRRIVAPSAGEHTYIWNAYRTSTNGTIVAGAGGVNVALPGYILVTKAA